MIEQLAMPLARRSDPATSHAAAESIPVGRTEQAILTAFTGTAGLTDDELCGLEPFARMHPPTVKSARSRLSKAGLLYDSGSRRLSNRGREQVVWRVQQSRGVDA